MMNSKKPIVICADDFGLSSEINRAILTLAKKGHISATSCMPMQQHWQAGAESLKELKTIALGLHFDLTEEGHPFSLLDLMIKSQLRQLDKAFIRRLFVEQLDAFEGVMERSPDFIDGHQHVHQFPVVRSVIMDVLSERFGGRADKPWLRYSNPAVSGHDASLKALVLRLISLGGGRFFNRHGFATNREFLGMYSLSEDASFAEYMAGWLSSCGADTLFMCHPGDFECLEQATDGMARARQNEFDFLNSAEFAQLLEVNSCSVVSTPGV